MRVGDLESGAEFTLALVGPIKEGHPVSRAEQSAIAKCSTTQEIIHAKRLALAAWQAEMIRAYEALGGDESASLRRARDAWVKFKEAQMTQVVELYGQRGGSISAQLVLQRETELTRDYANLLKDVLVW